MASGDSLVPLSDEELTKLATLAIEAKQAAYCKFASVLQAIFCSFMPRRKDWSHILTSEQERKHLLQEIKNTTVSKTFTTKGSHSLTTTTLSRPILELPRRGRRAPLVGHIPHGRERGSSEHAGGHLCGALCNRTDRGVDETARDARYPRHRRQHRHQPAGEPVRHVQAVHQRVRDYG